MLMDEQIADDVEYLTKLIKRVGYLNPENKARARELAKVIEMKLGGKNTMDKLSEEKRQELRDILGPSVSDAVRAELRRSIPNRFVPGGMAGKAIGAGGFISRSGSGDDGGFSRFGEFLHSIKRNPLDARLKSGLNEGSDSAGGFLVPEEFRANLLQLVMDRSIVRRFATVYPMASDTLRIPKVLDSSHASSVSGGVICYWTQEAGSKTAVEPSFGEVKLIAKKLTGYTYCSDELLGDSGIVLESVLVDIFSKAILFYETLAFLRGSGVGQPMGILTSGSFLAIARNTLTDIKLSDLVGMMARLQVNDETKCIWIASRTCIPKLMTLSVSSVGVLVWLPDAVGGAPGRLLGYPLYFSELLPSLGSQGDIILCDMSRYIIGDRQSLRVDSSPHVRFTTDETAWRFVTRLDGEPWTDTTFQPYAGDATSPFVGLTLATA